MARLARSAALVAALALVSPASAFAAAGGGSSSFGGGGGGGGFSGGGGGGFSGGGSGGGDWGTGEWIFFLLLMVVIGLVAVWSSIKTARYVRRRRARNVAVRQVSLAAAEDDAAFHPDMVTRWADYLFREAQAAWDARDRTRLAAIVGDDLLVEWRRRLDDFDAKGWHNRVAVAGDVKVEYIGLTNRAADSEDRVVVFITATIEDYVLDRNGQTINSKESGGKSRVLEEWWTLGKRDNRWIVFSIEQEAEGRHHVDGKIVATPEDDVERIGDQALVDLAVEDRVADGFRVSDVADLDFDGDAHAAALDLSLADARFAPDVLEAAARRAVAAWAEAVDGDDAPLEDVASPEALRGLLYPNGDGTRLVVRGPTVRQLRVTELDAGSEPPRMTIEVDVSGLRYVENRDTAAVVSGSRSEESTFTERWTLALDGPDDRPWRIVDAAAGALR